jgi:hypothetical protein
MQVLSNVTMQVQKIIYQIFSALIHTKEQVLYTLPIFSMTSALNFKI